jgi:hypothetical protein
VFAKMDHKFSVSSWAARNPLGIIALFISLIYGMSALLLGTSVTHLSAGNQTVLVGFIVLFPFVVLGVFGWLVANHHKKLYGPGDYRSDEGFLNAGGPILPSEFRKKLIETVQAADVEPSARLEQDHSVESRNIESDTQGTDSSKDASRSARAALTARAYLAEGLVVQEIQNEFGGTLMREFPIIHNGRRLILDGLLNVGRDWFVIETKYFRQASAFARVLVRVANEAAAYREALKDKIVGRLIFVLAVVVDEPFSKNYAEQLAVKYRDQVGPDVAIRIYSFGDLAMKYGVADEKP